MSTGLLSSTRRKVLVGSGAVGAAVLLSAHRSISASAGNTAPGQPSNQGVPSMAKVEDSAVRPFRFHASDEALADLRRRIAGTKWPSRELVTDASQGVQLQTMRELARYWQTEYDW